MAANLKTFLAETGDLARVAVPYLLCVKSTDDDELLVIEVDPATGELPTTGSGGGGGSSLQQYSRNGVDTSVTRDTATAANNRPLPVEIIAGDSAAPISYDSGASDAGTQRVIVASDQPALPVTLASVPLAPNAATETTLAGIKTRTDIVDHGVVTAAMRIAAQVGFGGSGVTRANDLPVASVSPLSSALITITGSGATSDITWSTAKLATFGLLELTVTNTGSNVIALQKATSTLSAYANVLLYNVSTGTYDANLSDGTFLVDLSGSARFRFNCTSYVGGTTGIYQTFTESLGRTLPQAITADALPLAPDAATETKQVVGNTSLASIDTKTPALVSGRTPVDGSGVTQPVNVTEVGGTSTSTNFGAPGAGTQRVAALLGIGSAAASVTNPVPTRSQGRAVITSYRQNLASDSLSTGYDEVVASTSAAVAKIKVFSPISEPLWLSTGAAASETVLLYVPPGGGDFDVAIPAGTRVAIRSETSTFSSQFVVITLLGQ